MNHNHCSHGATRVIFGNYICNQLNLDILKIGVLPYNEKMKFWTCVLIAPSPSVSHKII